MKKIPEPRLKAAGLNPRSWFMRRAANPTFERSRKLNMYSVNTNGMSRAVTRRIVSRSIAESEADAAADRNDLSRDVIGLGGAEEIDAIRRLLDGAQSAERDL